MELGLFGKKAVITASTDGIGYAVARGFLEEGARVLINGRNPEKARSKQELLEKEFGEDRVYLYVGDTASKEGATGLARMAEQIFGSVDCITACVGSGKPVADSRLDMAEWETAFDINLFSAVRLLRTFENLWDKETGGSIVLISSLAACSRISAPYAYAAAKQGVRLLSKYLADDYAERKIRVNSVIPGNVLYKGGRWEELLERDSQGVKGYIEQSVPMRRFGAPQEVADAVLFLSSARASFITGASLLIDGGQSRAVV